LIAPSQTLRWDRCTHCSTAYVSPVETKGEHGKPAHNSQRRCRLDRRVRPRMAISVEERPTKGEPRQLRRPARAVSQAGPNRGRLGLPNGHTGCVKMKGIEKISIQW